MKTTALTQARGLRLNPKDLAFLEEYCQRDEYPIPVATLLREIVEEWVQKKQNNPPKKESLLRERLIFLRSRVTRMELQLRDLASTLEDTVNIIDAEVNS